MSELQKPNLDDEPIVIHAPMTGDLERLAQTARPFPASVPSGLEPWVSPELRQAPASKPATAASGRVFGLDAFRGVLLLAMNFSFTIPPWGPFAKWMYHTQVPPSPTRAYVEVAGLTWQDFLFAMFVFTMASAIPIAMAARLARGNPYPEILWSSLKRGFLLLLLALLIGHVNPYWTEDYTKRGNIVAIAGLLVCFAVFVQPPREWKPAVGRALRYAGWIGALIVLFGVPAFYGKTFSFQRRDEIIAALAFATVAGTAIWLFTRRGLTWRLVALGVILAARAAAPHVDWIGSIWYASPMPWFYKPWYLDLLLIVIPGTIAGDLVRRWMQRPADAHFPELWSSRRLATLAFMGLSFAPVLAVGLYERRYPAGTLAAVTVMSALLALIARNPRSERDRVLSALYGWAALWLVIGMLVEPLEGGIKKDPQTLGFLMLMSGTAMATLASLLIVVDAFKAGESRLRPTIMIGQNSLFAYVVFMLGIEHLLWLTGIGNLFTSSWQLATVRSVVLTILVGAIVVFTTRKRLIWRA